MNVMAMMQRSTVVGVFADHASADRAVDELKRAGFRDDQIGVASRHADTATTTATAADTDDSHAGSGALTGALAGAGLGALAGLGILSGMIPVIGPAIAGGTLGIILSNAAGGAAVAGLVGALIGAGIPEEEAHYYNTEFEAGRTIVTVKAEARAAEATTILRRHGATDMQTSGTATGAACATTTTARGTTAASATTARPAAAHTAGGAQRMQVVEEELHAQKRPVEAGEVTLRKEVHTEHKTVEVPVRREEVVIERHAPTGSGVAASDIRPGEEIRVPVMEEQVTVQKTPVVKEEVSVGKRVVQDTERVTGEVRKEEVRVERTGDVDVTSKGKNPRK